ncbi:hypothetical protein [Spirobacillus cienkowskii]|jgi:hypothetical protein|uniref:Cytochrome B n=1 Tax=Spirobacillus cienkowskii TaxID=495820 RepID=A0A369KPB6_9BACT|nr:MAG: hypothetical protein DCC88_08955 [Spirobacillus cienkowskii]
MYELFLFTHSWLRWFVILLLIIVFLKTTIGWLKQKPFTLMDKILSSILLGFTHVQFLVGIILYFVLSPITQAAFHDFKFAIKSTALRFWTVEHSFLMILFVIFIQIGKSVSKRRAEGRKKHKILSICTGIGILLIIAGMPWPNKKDVGRPLFIEIPQSIEPK